MDNGRKEKNKRAVFKKSLEIVLFGVWKGGKAKFQGASPQNRLIDQSFAAAIEQNAQKEACIKKMGIIDA
ncbi:hypothetical protein NE547_08155 [Flavonifractor sp. DFI.6.63]|uniref:hypothetical protein n=1 Tax=Oscillospiraceae TaxID=216572 RepID=UPI002108F596|nr:hypothetical protein [Flavonifractor sp. DFI.6.63]MBS1384990.1 hypothetical protein [Flavonifractor sp.]MCQ5029510.1 hypothetical protein [Flavonifractor sp. DFI.6.63]MDU2196665.1 hypothetical protein [Clostridiales bacterium]